MIKTKVIKNKSSYNRIAKKYRNLIGEIKFERVVEGGFTNTSVAILTNDGTPEPEIVTDNEIGNEDLFKAMDIAFSEIGALIDGIFVGGQEDKEAELTFDEEYNLANLRIKRTNIIGSCEDIEKLLTGMLIMTTYAETNFGEISIPHIETGRINTLHNFANTVSLITMMFRSVSDYQKIKVTISDNSVIWEV